MRARTAPWLALLLALLLPRAAVAVLNSYKYFHEPPGGYIAGHYSLTYFDKIQSYDDNKRIQSDMFRAWALVTELERVEYWLAHGTLLGNWWNKKNLPWDYDMDVQVSAATLTSLAALNGTVWEVEPDLTLSPDGLATNYTLDVNPFIVSRIRGDGLNLIDARFIDMRVGSYIDITGLAETDAVRHPGRVSCKNNHRYLISDIYPLQKTVHEGVVAYTPYRVDRILTAEYGEKALKTTHFHNHHFDAARRLWLPDATEPAGDRGSTTAVDPDGHRKAAAASAAQEEAWLAVAQARKAQQQRQAAMASALRRHTRERFVQRLWKWFDSL